MIRLLSTLDIQSYEEFTHYMNALPMCEVLAIEGDFSLSQDDHHPFSQRMSIYRSRLMRDNQKKYLSKLVDGKYNNRVYREEYKYQFQLSYKRCRHHFFVFKFPHDFSEEFLDYHRWRHPMHGMDFQ